MRTYTTTAKRPNFRRALVLIMIIGGSVFVSTPSFASCTLVDTILSLLSPQQCSAPSPAPPASQAPSRGAARAASGAVAHSSTSGQDATKPATSSPSNSTIRSVVFRPKTTSAPSSHTATDSKSNLQAVPTVIMYQHTNSHSFPVAWFGLLLVAGISLPTVFLIAAGKRRLNASHRVEEAEHEWKALKTDLLSNVAHELRTPLTPVKGYAQMLAERDLPQERSAQIASHVVEAADKLEHMIDLLLNYASLQPGSQINSEPLDVLSIVSMAASDSKFGADAARLVIHGSSAVAQGDHRLLEQAMRELIDNALKFSSNQTMVEVAVTEVLDRVEILVADRGPGFDDESLQIMLEEFRQADSSATRQHGGLGLGLALAQRIATAHGGELRIQHRAGGGTIVSMTLPASSSMIFTA
ncbi:MAG: sensor histidine kinase [Actinomycetota bacterium]